jgi:predicted GTPase
VTFLDTPGLDTFDEEIPYIKQVIASSDLILFVIDAGVGFGAKEQNVYELLSDAGKK